MHGRAFQIRAFTIGQRRSSHVVFSVQALRERGTVVLRIGRLHLPALRRQASPRRHGLPRIGRQCFLWRKLRAVEVVEASLQYLGVAATPWQIAFVCPVSKAATTASVGSWRFGCRGLIVVR